MNKLVNAQNPGIIKAMNSHIDIKNVSVVFNKKTRALNDVTVSLGSGKIIGFIGPSGAGKTTLMRAIVGRQRVTTGEVRVLGQPAGSKNLRGKINYKTQGLSAYEDLTALENLDYFSRMLGNKNTYSIPKIISMLDLEQQANQVVATLSGGQQQRVSLGVALLGKPELLVLDEPTVGLDPLLREDLWKLFKEIANGGTSIIISSHVMEEAERCNELILIRNGEIVVHGSPKDIKKQAKTKTIEDSFLQLARSKS